MLGYEGPAYRRAILSLDDAIAELSPAGGVQRLDPLRARIRPSPGSRALRLEMTREGKIFGGNYGLEISTFLAPPTTGS